MSNRRLDEVSIFNNRLTFLIPHEWIAAEPGDDGAYLYHLPGARSGWFRVSLISIPDVAEPEARLRELFSEYDNVTRNTLTGNLIRRSAKESVENGNDLHIWYWFVGGVVPPNMVCEAVFSYTVLAESFADNETQSEVSLLEQLASKARFGA